MPETSPIAAKLLIRGLKSMKKDRPARVVMKSVAHIPVYRIRPSSRGISSACSGMLTVLARYEGHFGHSVTCLMTEKAPRTRPSSTAAT